MYRKTSISSFSTSSPLSDLLLTAALTAALSDPSPAAALAASPLPTPLPPSLVLRLLRRPSLSPSAKLSLYHFATAHSYTPSPAAHHALLSSLPLPLLLPTLRAALSSFGPDSLSPNTLRLLLDSLIHSSRFDDAISILELSHPALLDPHTYSSVLLAFLRKSQLSTALTLFHALPSAPSRSAANALLVALRRAGRRDDFCNVFDELTAGKFRFQFDKWTYNVCIHAFGKWGELRLAFALFEAMKAAGVAPDVCTYNAVVHALCVSGKVRDALAVYEEMKGSGYEPDRFTYETLIKGCCRLYIVDEAVRLFREMECNNVGAETVVFNTVIDGLMKVRRLDDACLMFEKMVADGVKASCYTYNILIDGLFRNGRPAAGFALFCDLRKKGQFVDAISYSIVISHLAGDDRVEEALGLITQMEDSGFVVDLVTITSVLRALHKNGNWTSAEQLMKHVKDRTLLPEVLRWKTNLRSSLQGPQDKGKDHKAMFRTAGNLGDIMSWVNPIERDNVEAEAKADQSDAFNNSRMFTVARGQRVQEKGAESFDVDMMNTYLSIFLARGKLSIACKFFEIFTSLGKEPMSYTYNSLMTSFIKKGYVTEAWGILQEMGDNLCSADIATYNVIIQGLGKMNKADLASAVLDQLLRKGGYVDIVMYNTLINALGKAGRIGEVNKMFNQMTGSGINPDVVTYNTLIDVHAKAGNVKDAYNYLRKMLAAGVSPNHVTDTTLDFLEKEIERQRYQKASIKREDV